MMITITKKVTIAKYYNLKAARRRASRFGLLLAILYCTYVQTAIWRLLIKILTSTSDSATRFPRKQQ